MPGPNLMVRKALSTLPWASALLRRMARLFRGRSETVITREIIRRHIARRGPVVVEIGSNDGEHTLWFLEVFEQPRVYCFEPDPRPAARFKQRLGGHPGVQLFEMAVSDREGEITFHQSDARTPADAVPGREPRDASGSIRAPKHHLTLNPDVTFERTIRVPTTTLDRWCEEHGVEEIDFLWMDVQGAEIDVFRGGRRMLARTRWVYTEFSDLELYEGQVPLAGLLRELKTYRVVEKFPGDVLLRNDGFA